MDIRLMTPDQLKAWKSNAVQQVNEMVRKWEGMNPLPYPLGGSDATAVEQAAQNLVAAINAVTEI